MADNIVKAEYLKAIDEDTNAEVLTQFIPPAPDETDRGGVTKQELEQIEQNKNDVSQLKEDIVKTFTSDAVSVDNENKYNIWCYVNLKANNEYALSLLYEKNEKTNCVYSKVIYKDDTFDVDVLNVISSGVVFFTPMKDVKSINIVILKNENSVYSLNIKKTGIVNSKTSWYKSNLVKSNLIKEICVEEGYVKNKLQIGRIEYNSLLKELIIVILDENEKQLYFFKKVIDNGEIIFNTKYGLARLYLNLNVSFYYSIKLPFNETMVYKKNQIIDYIQPEYYYNETDLLNGSVQNAISNKNSSDITKNLLKNLYEYSNRGYVFYGQEEDYIRGVKNGKEWRAPDTAYAYLENNKWSAKRIEDITLMDYSNIYSITGNHQGKVLALDIYAVVRDYINSKINGVENNELNKAKIIGLVRKYSKENDGLITFCSHMDNPYGGLWDEIDSTYPDAFKCILDESDGGIAKTWFNNFLDCCVDLFNSLIDENNNTIPVLFRPFHERFALSFWWNHSTGEEWNSIWIKMVNYVNERCDNVLWVYNPCRYSCVKMDLTEYYVGDDYVDIIGTNIYLEEEETSDIHELKYLLDANGITDLYNFAKRHGKVCAIPELGSTTIPDYWSNGINILLNRCGIKPAYCTTWYNTSNEVRVPYDSTTEDGKKYILFLNNVCRGYEIKLTE